MPYETGGVPTWPSPHGKVICVQAMRIRRAGEPGKDGRNLLLASDAQHRWTVQKRSFGLAGVGGAETGPQHCTSDFALVEHDILAGEVVG